MGFHRFTKTSSFDDNDDVNIHTSPGALCFVIDNKTTGSQLDKLLGIVNNTYVAKDTDSLLFFIKFVNNLGYHKYLILNLTAGVTYNVKRSIDAINLKNIEIFTINGNGATINVINKKDSGECKFLELVPGSICFMNNLTLRGFNKAIINEGALFISNSLFQFNKCDYWIKKDSGGSIFNDGGYAEISGCRFEEGYAKYGAAIYNDEGIVKCLHCLFKSNLAYGEGGSIYNQKGFFVCSSCDFSYSRAKNGGAIYNHMGSIILSDDTFSHSTAKKRGGAVYNDIGDCKMESYNFTESVAGKSGSDFYSYGDSYFSINNTYSLKFDGNKIVSKKCINLNTGKPSKLKKWLIRAGEVLACVAVSVICIVAQVPAVAGVFISVVTSGIIAAGGTYLEEYYVDHDVSAMNIAVVAAFSGVFAGLTDCIAGYIGNAIINRVSSEVAGQFVRAAAQEVKLAVFVLTVDTVSSVISEVVPLGDFRDFDLKDVEQEMNESPLTKDVSDNSNQGASNLKIIFPKIVLPSIDKLLRLGVLS